MPCIAVALLLVAAMPATAMGAARVSRSTDGIITIQENVVGADDEITILVSGNRHLVRDPGGVIVDSAGDCIESGASASAVHAAWRTDVDAAGTVVLRATRRHRTPETLRRARRLARSARSGASSAGP